MVSTPLSVSYYRHASLSLVSSNHTAIRVAELGGKSLHFDARNICVGIPALPACMSLGKWLHLSFLVCKMRLLIARTQVREEFS